MAHNNLGKVANTLLTASEVNELLKVESDGGTFIGGTLGVGLSSEASKTLVIEDSTDPTFQIQDGAGNTLVFEGPTTVRSSFMGTGSSDELNLGTNGVDAVLINTLGNMGVGTTTIKNDNTGQTAFQMGSRCSLGANTVASGGGQTFLMDNLFFEEGTGFQVMITSEAVEGASIQLFEGIFAYSTSVATTGTPTVTEKFRIEQNGQVGIGTSSPATSALVDMTSTTGALLLTRMTTTQRNALTAENGMVIYNSTTNAFNFYENGSWVTK